jgi:hypothetical protein
MRGGDYACATFWREQKLLLGKRSPQRRAYPNCWDILGGKKEEGETLEQALIPIGADPHALTQSRRPMDMIVQG